MIRQPLSVRHLSVPVRSPSADDQSSFMSLSVCERPAADLYHSFTWPSATALASLLARLFARVDGDLCILELGCGTGVASLAAAVSNPRVRAVCTDMCAEAGPLVLRSAALNRVEQQIEFRQLAFDDLDRVDEILASLDGQVDWLVGADLLYCNEGCWSDLFCLISHVLTSAPGCRGMLMAFEARTLTSIGLHVARFGLAAKLLCSETNNVQLLHIALGNQDEERD
jgi:hypothetical protein